MKNYIANERLGFDTSAGYLRRKLQECIKCGRSGRRGNETDRKEALIHLGALLHTLEDFSAHSNYVELVLQCLGEEKVFAYVGDQCRISVPSKTKTVPPLVTGTFGALDIFQSIIGEIDDKAAIQNKGELTTLELVSLQLTILRWTSAYTPKQRIAGISNDDFQNMAAQVANALQYIVLFIPGAENMASELQNTVKIVSASKKDPLKYDPNSIDISHGTNELWKAVEPIFDFHGKVARFFIEHEEDLKIPFVSAAKQKLGEAIDK